MIFPTNLKKKHILEYLVYEPILNNFNKYSRHNFIMIIFFIYFVYFNTFNTNKSVVRQRREK